MPSKPRFLLRILRHRLNRQPRVCPYCSGSAHLKLLRRKKIVLDILKCEACRLVFRWPTDTPEESDAYFQTRPRGSQLGAWVSQQSSVITTRKLLEAKLEEMKRKFAGGEVPVPSWWGGFRVVPQEIEFWQGRASRLHDRFLYTREPDDSWNIERLAP